jgi:PAS domain S-box-containing protein
VYDLSRRELEALEMLGQGMGEQEIAESLEIDITEYRKLWADLAHKFDWLEPQTAEGRALALKFERARSAALLASLHAAQTRLRALMDLTPNGILIVDGRTGKSNQANKHCAQLYGYSVSELLNIEVEKLLDPELRNKHVGLRLGFLRSIRKREIGYHPPIFAMRKDGSKIELVIGLTSSTTTDEVMVICTEYSKVMAPEGAVN